jgi:hypothetical protein
MVKKPKLAVAIVRWAVGMSNKKMTATAGVVRTAPMILKELHFDWFDHSANWPVKVRNVSRLGSHLFLSNSPTRYSLQGKPHCPHFGEGLAFAASPRNDRYWSKPGAAVTQPLERPESPLRALSIPVIQLCAPTDADHQWKIFLLDVRAATAPAMLRAAGVAVLH